MIKNKRALSEIVSYVLLIVIAISLSFMVYVWLKSQIPKETEECPEKVSLLIKDYLCNSTDKTIDITLENNGLFDIEGFIAKISNKSGSLPIHSLKGFSPLNTEGQFYFDKSLEPNKEFENKFIYKKQGYIFEIEITPLKIVKGEVLLCEKSASKQEIRGCE